MMCFSASAAATMGSRCAKSGVTTAHRIYAGICCQISEIRVDPFGAVRLRYLLCPLGIVITNRGQSGAGVIRVDLGMHLPPEANADHTEAYGLLRPHTSSSNTIRAGAPEVPAT